MRLIEIYKCLCDETRLRILNVLSISPLCGCHVQDILGKSQVVVSQHLSYLRERGMVTSQRHRNWIIYSLPTVLPPELEMNLKCLQDCVQSEPVFQKDRAATEKLFGSQDFQALLQKGCGGPAVSPGETSCCA
jgi:DNA-binding transcriptional ArsR family regulator